MLLELNDYKSLRGIEDTDRDAALMLGLEAAEAAVKSITGESFATASGVSTKTFDYNGSGFLTTPYFTTATAVAVDGQTLGSEFYTVGPPEGPPFNTISPGAGPSSPLMGFRRNLDTYFGCWWARRACRVAVTAEWGWPAGAPADVKMAVAMLTDEFAPKEDADAEGVQARAIESYSVVYGSSNSAGELPPQVRELLATYTRPRF